VHIQKRRTDDPIWLLPDLLPYLAARLGAQPSARADMYPPSWCLSFAMLNLDRLLWKIPVLHHGVQALLGTRFVPEGAQLDLLLLCQASNKRPKQMSLRASTTSRYLKRYMMFGSCLKLYKTT
jgi:hypothetical protein